MAIDFSNDSGPSTSVLRKKQRQKTVRVQKKSAGGVTMIFGMMMIGISLLFTMSIGGVFTIKIFEFGVILFVFGLAKHTYAMVTGVMEEVRKK